MPFLHVVDILKLFALQAVMEVAAVNPELDAASASGAAHVHMVRF